MKYNTELVISEDQRFAAIVDRYEDDVVIVHTSFRLSDIRGISVARVFADFGGQPMFVKRSRDVKVVLRSHTATILWRDEAASEPGREPRDHTAYAAAATLRRYIEEAE